MRELCTYLWVWIAILLIVFFFGSMVKPISYRVDGQEHTFQFGRPR